MDQRPERNKEEARLTRRVIIAARLARRQIFLFIVHFLLACAGTNRACDAEDGADEQCGGGNRDRDMRAADDAAGNREQRIAEDAAEARRQRPAVGNWQEGGEPGRANRAADPKNEPPFGVLQAPPANEPPAPDEWR